MFWNDAIQLTALRTGGSLFSLTMTRAAPDAETSLGMVEALYRWVVLLP